MYLPSWISELHGTSNSLCFPPQSLNTTVYNDYSMPVLPLPVVSFASQVCRSQGNTLDKLCAMNYTWGTSSILGPDSDDEILGFEWILKILNSLGTGCVFCIEGQRMDYGWPPSDPCLLGFTLLCSVFLLSSVWGYWLTSNKQNTAEVIGCQFWAEVIKNCGFHLRGSLTIFWMAQSGKIQLPCHQAACGKFHRSELESGPSEACQLPCE